MGHGVYVDLEDGEICFGLVKASICRAKGMMSMPASIYV
jgi:hypothetical protein